MKTIWLICQRLGYFVLVLFLSSFFLAAFLWISPGSPGRPRELVNWDDAVVDKTFVCVGKTNASCGLFRAFRSCVPITLPPWQDMPSECGVTEALSLNQGVRVDVLVAGELRTEREGYVKMPGPSFNQWFSVDFWGGLFRGDVGLSTAYQEPALQVVLDASRHTLPIVFGTLLVSVLLALLLTGILLWLPFPSLRGAIRTALMLASITPVFIIVFILQSKALGLGLVPQPVPTTAILLACVVALCIGDSNLGEILLQFGHEVRAIGSTDYVHAARLRGASVFKHMLPGLLLPISSISAAKVAFLLGSVVIVEWLFGVPGLGEASLKAAVAKDGDAVLLVTLTLLITAVVALVALVRDVIEILVDPRLRKGQGAGH